jgi:DNA (cytosine-5)-methyltransferase 1
MNHGSLFSGIGGFDLASQWMGWDNIFHCEWNDFGQRVLKHHFPNSISYGDITTTDFTIHRGQIDILTGGFPCQPYSQAGKRLGKEDDRHLWPEMLRAIREIQPRWVVGENVLGLVNWNGGLVFDEVQADLENEGYVVQPYVLPACAVNAPHRRDRVWFASYSADTRVKSSRPTGQDKVFGFKTASKPTLVGWYGFPTKSAVCGSHDGIPRKLDAITFPKWREESVKAYGNAIVPQVAHQIFKAIQAYEVMT